MRVTNQSLNEEIDIAERKAWEALSRYKFMMFGYWAAIWVHLNRISSMSRSNPWSAIVGHAKRVVAEPSFEATKESDDELLQQMGLEI